MHASLEPLPHNVDGCSGRGAAQDHAVHNPADPGFALKSPRTSNDKPQARALRNHSSRGKENPCTAYIVDLACAAMNQLSILSDLKFHVQVHCVTLRLAAFKRGRHL